MPAAHRNRPLLALALLGAGAASAAALALPGAALGATRTVTLRNIAFNPARLTIDRGDTVVWRWRDGATRHNVTSRSFKGASTRSSGTYRFRFGAPGTYRYRCTLHPGMNGTVVVRR